MPVKPCLYAPRQQLPSQKEALPDRKPGMAGLFALHGSSAFQGTGQITRPFARSHQFFLHAGQHFFGPMQQAAVRLVLLAGLADRAAHPRAADHHSGGAASSSSLRSPWRRLGPTLFSVFFHKGCSWRDVIPVIGELMRSTPPSFSSS